MIGRSPAIDRSLSFLALFAGSGQTLADAQLALDSGNPHVTGFELRGLQASLTTRVDTSVGWLDFVARSLSSRMMPATSRWRSCLRPP